MGGAGMRGFDKGGVLLAGKRLFDHVHERLAPQVGGVLVSGDHDYGAGLITIPDCAEGPAGPAAGLFAVMQWLKAAAPDCRRFVTAPVDAPFLPGDLVRRLTEKPGSAVVSCAGRLHPTFACWELAPLSVYFQSSNTGPAPALHKLASALSAREASFEDETAFANINTREELKQAETVLARKG